MRHAQVHRLPLAIHGYGGKDYVAAGLALKLPHQMHPGFGRRCQRMWRQILPT